MSALRALASSLGLSITTVSRALDGYGDVAATTRERVRRAAEAANYRPNATSRTRIPAPSPITNPSRSRSQGREARGGS